MADAKGNCITNQVTILENLLYTQKIWQQEIFYSCVSVSLYGKKNFHGQDITPINNENDKASALVFCAWEEYGTAVSHHTTNYVMRAEDLLRAIPGRTTVSFHLRTLQTYQSGTPIPYGPVRDLHAALLALGEKR